MSDSTPHTQGVTDLKEFLIELRKDNCKKSNYTSYTVYIHDILIRRCLAIKEKTQSDGSKKYYIRFFSSNTPTAAVLR